MYPKQIDDIETLCKNKGGIIPHLDCLKIPIIPHRYHVDISLLFQEKMKQIHRSISKLNLCNTKIQIHFSNNLQFKDDFCGNYVYIGYTNTKYRQILLENSREFIQIILEAAKKREIDLSYGISF